MIPQAVDSLFLNKFSNVGTEKFYKYLLNYSIVRITTEPMVGISPEIELINYHDKFLSLYRREQNQTFLEMAKVFRKAAHKIYRIMLKKEMIEKNNRFLNVVK